MAKYCSYCGQLSDDTAQVCAACGSPFAEPSYNTDDEATVIIDGDPYGGADQPRYQQSYEQQFGQQDRQQYQPQYQQPQYQQQDRQPYQNYGYDTPAQNNAVPLNVSPLGMDAGQQYPQPVEKKNKKKALIIGIIAGILVIAAVVTTIILVSNNGGSSTGNSVVTQTLQGSYYLEHQDDHGTNITREMVKLVYGSDLCLDVNSDNTGKMYTDDEHYTVTFNPSDHTFTMNGVTGTYTYDGEKLDIYTDEGQVINHFVKK